MWCAVMRTCNEEGRDLEGEQAKSENLSCSFLDEGTRDLQSGPTDPGSPGKAEHSLQEGRGSLPVLVWPWSQVLQR